LSNETPPMHETINGRDRIGARLAAARTAAGLELADIARDTRVPLRHLRAIEADAHESLPALPYTIGFVKTLARAVGVDPEAAAAQFRAETSKTAHVPAAVALEPLDERRLPPRELVVFSLIAGVALVGGIIAYASGVFDKAPPPPPVVIAAAVPAPALENSPDIGVATPAAGVVLPPAVGPTAAAPVSVTGQVTFTPTEDVWVKIYDAQGTTVKSGILTAGAVFVVPPMPPALMIRTGKPGVLGIAIAGKPLAPIGGPVQTIKDVSLAPADLVARSAAMAAGTPVAAPATAPAAGPR